MCMIEDAEIADIYRETVVHRARKPHKCLDCFREIAPGESYTAVDMLYDGRWTHEEMCAHCHAAAQWLVKECGGFLVGGIEEDLEMHWREEEPYIGRFSLGKLIWGIRNKWQRHGTLMAVPHISAVAA